MKRLVLMTAGLLLALGLMAQDVQVEEFGTQEVWRSQAEAALERGDFRRALDLAERACAGSQDADEQMACRWLAARAGCRLGTQTGWPALDTFLRTWPGQFALQPTDPCLDKSLRGKFRKKLGTLALPELPAGSRVFLDGVEVLRLGKTLVWPAGSVQLRLMAPGYRPQAWDLDVPARGQGTFEPEWDPVSRPLTIFARPLGAELFLNGVSVGSAGPVPEDLDPSLVVPAGGVWGFIAVEPRAFGEYRAELRAPCHLPKEMRLRVPEEGAPTPLHLAPVSLQYAEVPLNLKGPGSPRVKIDGLDLGSLGDKLSVCAGAHDLEVLWAEGSYRDVLEVKGDRPLDLEVFPRWDLHYGGILNRVPGAGPVIRIEQDWEVRLATGCRWQNVVSYRDFPDQQTFLQSLLQANRADRARLLLERRGFDPRGVLFFGESLDGKPNGRAVIHLVDGDGHLESLPLERLNQPGRVTGQLFTARAPLYKLPPGEWRLEPHGWTLLGEPGDLPLSRGARVWPLGGRGAQLPLDLGRALGVLPFTQAQAHFTVLHPDASQEDLALSLNSGIELVHPERTLSPYIVLLADLSLARRLDLDGEGRGLINRAVLLSSLGDSAAALEALQQASTSGADLGLVQFFARRLGLGSGSSGVSSQGWLDRPGGFPLPVTATPPPPHRSGHD